MADCFKGCNDMVEAGAFLAELGEDRVEILHGKDYRCVRGGRHDYLSDRRSCNCNFQRQIKMVSLRVVSSCIESSPI